MITTDQKERSSTGVTPLVAGIIDDAQTLVRQQLALFKSEVKSDLTRAKDAAISFQIGVAISLLAGGFIFLALGEWAMRIWPELPALVVHGVIGLVLIVVGGVVLLVAKNNADAVSPLDGKPSDDETARIR